MSFHKSKTLYDGIVAEFVVMDALLHNQMLLEKGLGMSACVDLDNAPSFPTSDSHHDLDINVYLCDTGELQDTKTVEVKYAWNPQYPTFFAEITQLKSQTYAEYLVYPPDFMFYINGFNKMLYCYDGKEFVEGVKKNYNNRRTNSFDSADGVLFGLKDKDFGYLFSYPCKQNYFNVKAYKQKEIEIRLAASEGVSVKGSKESRGLPSLA